MSNPWEEIALDDYEKHMSLDSVKQLQAMNEIMKEQFEAYPAETAMVLGAAGGNGFEHIRREKYRKVYGVDINREYLDAVAKRYAALSGVLECVAADLTSEADRLPKAELVIANLLIEYIGYDAFRDVIMRTAPEYVSCVIQINTDAEKWVSDSPYLHTFDRLDEVHHQMDESELTEVMRKTGYTKILQKTVALPNGKALARLDFGKK